MDASEGIDGRKRVALALLGLQRADRKWLLAQLPGAERDSVAAMLGELERMKLPAAPQQIAAAAGALTADHSGPRSAPWIGEAQPLVPAGAAEPADATALHPLAQRSAAAVHRVLRDESDAVIASVCALGDWPWASELSSRLGPARAADIARLREQGMALPAAVGEALLAALNIRAEACVAGGQAGFAAELRAASVPALPALPAQNGQRWWGKLRRS